MNRLVVALLLALHAFAAPAQAAPRVAALTPFSASTITRLGVRPVVLGQTLGGTDQYLASLRGVPVIPLTHPLGPNMEQLATHNASIVLSSKTWQRGTPAMRRLGMKVYESDPTSVAAVGRETRAIGKVLGRTRAANALATKIENDVRAAQQGIKRRPRVLVILGVGRTPHAMLANSWGGDVVAQAGGQLLTDGLRSASGIARISDEIVVQRNPGHHHRRAAREPGQHLAARRVLPVQPELAQHAGRQEQARLRRAPGNSLLQPYPGVGGDDPRRPRQVPEELARVERSALVRRRSPPAVALLAACAASMAFGAVHVPLDEHRRADRPGRGRPAAADRARAAAPRTVAAIASARRSASPARCCRARSPTRSPRPT